MEQAAALRLFLRSLKANFVYEHFASDGDANTAKLWRVWTTKMDHVETLGTRQKGWTAWTM